MCWACTCTKKFNRRIYIYIVLSIKCLESHCFFLDFIFLLSPHSHLYVYIHTHEVIPKRMVMAMLVEFISRGRNSSKLHFHLHMYFCNIFIISLLTIYVTKKKKKKTFYRRGKRQVAWFQFIPQSEISHGLLIYS